MTWNGSSARLVALIVLLVVAAVALRGALPGDDGRRPAQHPLTGVAALILIVALLAVSLVIVAVAVLARMRDPRASAAASAPPDWLRGGARPRWRLVVGIIAVAMSMAVLAVVVSRIDIAPPERSPAASTTAATSTGEPPVTSPTAASPEAAEPPAGRELMKVLYGTAIGFLVLVAVSSVVTARRNRRADRPHGVDDGHGPAAAAIEADPLVRAAEVGLAEVGDPSREPRAAIIACYAAMERELARVPAAAPRDFDTASEVLARAVEQDALHSDSAAQLVDLFEEARFSPHVMDEGHRESASAALQLVLADLQGQT